MTVTVTAAKRALEEMRDTLRPSDFSNMHTYIATREAIDQVLASSASVTLLADCLSQRGQLDVHRARRAGDQHRIVGLRHVDK